MRIVLLIALLFSAQAFADWKVIESESGDQFVASNLELKFDRVPLISAGGTPRVLEVKEVVGQPGLKLVRYRSGVAGTSAKYEIFRSVVMDIKTGRSLGDYPVEYKAVGKAPKIQLQPKWEWSPRKLKITDPHGGETGTIQF
jgi:hypothetical protein